MPIETSEIIDVVRSVIRGHRHASVQTNWMSPNLVTNDGWLINFFIRRDRHEVDYAKAPDGRETELPDIELAELLSEAEMASLLPMLDHGAA